MAKIRAITGRTVTRLDRGWEVCVTEAGHCESPANLQKLVDWLPAPVPGTVAAALQKARRWTLDQPAPLHDKDAWYRVALSGRGLQVLRLAGLATIAEVYLDGVLILSSDNMYISYDIDILLSGEHELTLCFRAMLPALAATKGQRARWRTVLASPASLRFKRTTLLGHMNGWCPPVHIVGPWRAIELISTTENALAILASDVRTSLEGKRGTVHVGLSLLHPPAVSTVFEIVCGGLRQPMRWTSPTQLGGTLHLEGVAPWWPHTHGRPHLHELHVEAPNCRIEFDAVGFRTIAVDRGRDGEGFGLIINGEPVFCRGACWTSADIVKLDADPARYRHLLELAVEAGMNMLRISGTCVYESDLFYRLCDELGILVWQDYMFANFDYPISEAGFARSVEIEVQQFLDRTSTSPCLAVLCGGSEVLQQAAMLGLTQSAFSSPLYDEILPRLSQNLRPDVVYLPNSPSGGNLPFVADTGVSHYYGIGAYLKPLEDARRANVRFASECLAFAHVPDHSAYQKERVPRDNGASWDFEDVRDHYLGLLHDVDAVQLRNEDPVRYLELSRAVTADIIEATFVEWRRKESPTNGALVWTFQDLWEGQGWGVIGADGMPKSSWYAMKRVLSPVHLGLTDEGVNGLRIHWRNETSEVINASLHFVCLRDGVMPVRETETPLQMPARASGSINATEPLGSFFDTTYTYRFGPPAHDTCIATLSATNSGLPIGQSFYFPLGRKTERSAVAIEATLEKVGNAWGLVLRCEQLARRVYIEDAAFAPDDNWFHLAPGREKHIELRKRNAGTAAPVGSVRAVNSSLVSVYGVQP